jgi:hypothetical protein
MDIGGVRDSFDGNTLIFFWNFSGSLFLRTKFKWYIHVGIVSGSSLNLFGLEIGLLANENDFFASNIASDSNQGSNVFWKGEFDCHQH